MSLCIWYHINALELVGGISSRLARENPRSRMLSPCRGFPFIVGLLVPEAVESPHNRVHSQLNGAVAYKHSCYSLPLLTFSSRGNTQID